MSISTQLKAAALASVAAMGAFALATSGPALAKGTDLASVLTRMSAGDVLFIDEIHRLPIAVEEFIYPAMEDFRVDITLGDGMNARTINMKLQQFTVIGATASAR